MDNPELYQIMTQSVIRWKIERVILHKFNASLQPPVQFQFIHRMQLILNIISHRCIIYGWLCNANGTPWNSRARFRSNNEKYEDGVEESTSFSLLPQNLEVKRSHFDIFPFADEEHGNMERRIYVDTHDRVEPPRVSCNRGEANEHSPGSPSSGLSSFVAYWRSLSLLDSQIAFQGDSNGLSVIDRRTNRWSVQFEQRKREEMDQLSRKELKAIMLRWSL